MRRERVAVLVIGLAVVLAGCQFIPVDDGTDDGATPTAEPGETPAVADAAMPPGIDDSGVTDADALLSAHAAALEGESTTVGIDFQLTIDGEGDRAALEGKTDPGSDRGWMRVDLREGVGEYYTEGETTYEKVTADGTTRYTTTDDVSAIPDQPRFGADERIGDAIDAGNWTATGVTEHDGTDLIRFEAVEIEVPVVDDPDATVEASGELLVDEYGVVHHAEIYTEVEADGETVEYGIEVTLSEIGSTTVEEPDWTEHAQPGG